MNRNAIKAKIKELKKLDWSFDVQDQIDLLNHQLDREMSVPRYLRL